MKVPFSWLKTFVNIDISAEELAEKLVFAGFEIEEIIYLRDTIKNVRTGKIVSISRHTNSDHLSICQINFDKEQLQIVTGAKNVQEGDIVPVALDGATLPDGKKIISGELRGEISQGMLCSGGDLGLIEEDFLGAGVDGIWIMDKNTPINADINDIIGNNEIVLDVAITANRPDCNSILGIAREVAAVLKKPLIMPNFSYEENSQNIADYLTIENQNYTLCPRYMAKTVINIKQEISPKIIRDRLKHVGIRSINNLVDLTNYVLVEIGQPMHAFDLDLIGDKIIIRTAFDGEKIVALDDKNYALTPSNLAICDKDKPIAIAGVMGGKNSSICDTTKAVVLESARFARDSVRHTARELNLHSDSSARFEKGVDFYAQESGLNRALALICQYNWGEIVGGHIDLCQSSLQENSIVYHYNQVNKVLGIVVPKQTIIDILNSLSLKTTAKGEELTTVIPLHREDIVGINDLAEEVIRIYGYEYVTPQLLSNKRGGKRAEQLRLDKLKNILTGKGALEICSYSFISPKAFDMLLLRAENALRTAIELRNPLGADLSVMRTSLSYSMIKTIAYNHARGNKNFRLFEVASVYQPKALPLTELPYEHAMLSIGTVGQDNYYNLKSIIEDIMDIFAIPIEFTRANIEYLHGGRSANIVNKDNQIIGYLGEIHPDVAVNFDIDKTVCIAEIDVEYIVNNGVDIKPFKAISKYQAMERDLALISPLEMPSKLIIDTITGACSHILESAEVFDVYTGGQVAADKKSVAIKLTFRDSDRTLKDGDVSAEIDKILVALQKIDVFLR